ncbi:MAG: YdcF family protein, partial [Nodosilinea sp.]
AYDSQRALCSDICTVDDIPFNLARAMVVIGDNADAGLSSSLPSRIDSQVRLDPILVSRLNSAADVYRRLDGVNPWVTVTAGARTSGEEGKQLNEAIRQVLSARGVPADRVELINTGLDIHGVVEHQKKFLKDRGLFTPAAGNPRRQTQRNNREANRVVLVAPALTMRRAALAFEQQGLQVVAWPTELYGAGAVQEDSKLARLVDLVPNVAALWLTTRYWEELLTSLYYYLRGWLPPFTMQWDGVIEVIETLP